MRLDCQTLPAYDRGFHDGVDKERRHFIRILEIHYDVLMESENLSGDAHKQWSAQLDLIKDLLEELTEPNTENVGHG